MAIISNYGPRSLRLREEYQKFLDTDEFLAEICDFINRVPLVIFGPNTKRTVSNVEYHHIDLLTTVKELFILE